MKTDLIRAATAAAVTTATAASATCNLLGYKPTAAAATIAAAATTTAVAARLARRPVPVTLLLLGLSALQPFSPSPAADPAAKPSITTSAPVKNFRLPAFNEQGHRTSLLTGGEGRYISPDQIDVTRLDFVIYPGDGSARVETRLTAPTASFFLKDTAAPRASGRESVRLEHENKITATGEDWAYDHGLKKLWINKNVRLVFPAPLQDILK